MKEVSPAVMKEVSPAVKKEAMTAAVVVAKAAAAAAAVKEAKAAMTKAQATVEVAMTMTMKVKAEVEAGVKKRALTLLKKRARMPQKKRARMPQKKRVPLKRIPLVLRMKVAKTIAPLSQVLKRNLPSFLVLTQMLLTVKRKSWLVQLRLKTANCLSYLAVLKLRLCKKRHLPVLTKRLQFLIPTMIIQKEGGMTAPSMLRAC